MKYNETFKSIFTIANEGYTIAHTISADFGMGNSLQRQINKRYNTKETLKNLYASIEQKHAVCDWDALDYNKKGFCLYEEPVLNLVVKRSWKGMPTYTSIRNALYSLKEFCSIYGISKVVMPKIGTGEDKLSWDKIKSIIEEVFADTDIEIVISKYFRKANPTDNPDLFVDGFSLINAEIDELDFPFGLDE